MQAFRINVTTDGSGNGAITFPVAFSTGLLMVTATVESSANGNFAIAQVESASGTTTGVTVFVTASGSAVANKLITLAVLAVGW